MKTLVLGALGAALLFATPSFAQDVRIRAGESGISVRTDDGRPGWRRHHRSERVVIRERRPSRVVIREHRPRRVVIRDNGPCRMVSIRTERPNGTVVIRRERRCG